jgi:hypothetical protein
MNEILPTDIFGQPYHGAQIAHLIPANHNNATLFFDVAIWALGFPIDEDWDTLQKAIHGVFHILASSILFPTRFVWPVSTISLTKTQVFSSFQLWICMK